MILNFILDTNEWIYIAEGDHKEVLGFLIEEVNRNKIRILTNDIIIKQWVNNKERITEKMSRKFVIDLVEINSFNARIAIVEEILYKKAFKTKIDDEMIAVSEELKKNNKAPFHRGEDNIEDALIFLSTLNYLNSQKMAIDIERTVFITNDIGDFSAGRGSTKNTILHEDFRALASTIHLDYIINSNILDILVLGPKYIEEIREYWEHYNERRRFAEDLAAKTIQIPRIIQRIFESEKKTMPNFRGRLIGVHRADLTFLEQIKIIEKGMANNICGMMAAIDSYKHTDRFSMEVLNSHSEKVDLVIAMLEDCVTKF